MTFDIRIPACQALLMTESSAYREALRAAEAHARELEVQIRHLQQALTEKTAELGNITNLKESLAALLGPDPHSPNQTSPTARRSGYSRSGTDADSGRPRMMHIRQALLTQDPTQVELIILWLFEVPAGLSREEIENRFKKHSVSAGWKDPKNSVRTALWRATNQGLIRQDGDDHFILPLEHIERAKLEALRRNRAT